MAHPNNDDDGGYTAGGGVLYTNKRKSSTLPLVGKLTIFFPTYTYSSRIVIFVYTTVDPSRDARGSGSKKGIKKSNRIIGHLFLKD